MPSKKKIGFWRFCLLLLAAPFGGAEASFWGSLNPTTWGIANDCVLPPGSYPQSCHGITVNPRTTTDPYIKEACWLEADCEPVYESMPQRHSGVVVPMLGGIEVENRNGTLAYVGESQEKCPEPKGSFQESCKSAVGSYTSPDPELRGAPLCQMFAKSRTTKGQESSTAVYFGTRTRAQTVERCSKDESKECSIGKLKVGGDDSMCAGKTPEEIAQVAKKAKRPGL